MEFIITSISRKIIISNIKEPHRSKQLIACEKELESVICVLRNCKLRQGRIYNDNYILYLATDSTRVTNKIFKHYFDFYKAIAAEVISSIESSKAKESQRTRRLKHNLINHNTGNLQELYRVFSQEHFKTGANHLDVIQGVISNNSRKSAYAFLRVLKNSNLMKAEFDVYEMLDQESPLLNFAEHPIHKVVTLVINPFWLDLIEKKTNIIIQEFYEKIIIDYKTMSVALSHVFDNATKYIYPGSDFKISFENSTDSIKIIFNMISLKILPEELASIFNENISGKYAGDNGMSGDGIGMFITKKLIELNNGIIKLKVNVNPALAKTFENLPYENNILEVILKKQIPS
jgi:signal transduction histidine kinase